MYQFVHVESYSRATPKTAQHANKKTGKASSKKGGHCVSYIVNEAIREANSIPHIDNPMPPNYLYGEPLETLEAACDTWADGMKDGRGHKMRKDALCLLAGVVSAPNDIPEEDWTRFRNDAVEWLKAKYGEALRTVIEHRDESHPHLHFYCVPQAGQRFESVHQGKAAAAAAKLVPGAKKGAENKAYKAAMRVFQDEFFAAVGIQNGMTRIGPGKRRLTREEWKLEQIQAAAAARSIALANDRVDGAEAVAEAVRREAIEEAKAIAGKALEQADIAEKSAFEKGFAAGIAALENLSWWKKAGAFLSSVVRERDELKDALATEKAKSKSLGEKLAEAVKKTKKFWELGTKFEKLFKDAKPKMEKLELDLAVAEGKAADAARLRGKISDLEGHVVHLEATVEAYQLAEEQAIEAAEAERRAIAAERREKQRKNDGDDLDLK